MRESEIVEGAFYLDKNKKIYTTWPADPWTNWMYNHQWPVVAAITETMECLAPFQPGDRVEWIGDFQLTGVVVNHFTETQQPTARDFNKYTPDYYFILPDKGKDFERHCYAGPPYFITTGSGSRGNLVVIGKSSNVEPAQQMVVDKCPKCGGKMEWVNLAKRCDDCWLVL